MRAVRIDPITQSPSALEYTDAWGETEFVFAREGLCSRAGCWCVGGALICNNFSYVFFSEILHSWYASACSTTCTCETVTEPGLRPVPWEFGGDRRNLTVNLIESPDRARLSTSTIHRENPGGGTAGGGFGSCLKGEAMGWTVKGVARCCAGYTFHALTAQEAYETYGVAPYAGDVLAAAATIGVCLKQL